MWTKFFRARPLASCPCNNLTEFELVINPRTARALGLEISATILALSDDVIA